MEPALTRVRKRIFAFRKKPVAMAMDVFVGRGVECNQTKGTGSLVLGFEEFANHSLRRRHRIQAKNDFRTPERVRGPRDGIVTWGGGA